MLEATDEQHLALALSSRRVLFTQDTDFLRLHARGHTHAGIVYAPQQSSVGTLVAGLMLVHDALTRTDMANHVEFL